MREQELSPNLLLLSTFISHIRVIILMNTKMILAAVALSLSLAACAKKEEAARGGSGRCCSDGSCRQARTLLLTLLPPRVMPLLPPATPLPLRPRRRLLISRRPQPQQ